MHSPGRLLACLALGSALVASACGRPEEPAASVPALEAPASPAAKFYAYAARADFVRDMLRDLVVINQALHDLIVEIEDSSEKAVTKAERRAELIALIERAAGLTIDLDKVSTVGEAVWEQAKADSQKSSDEFRASVAVARVSLSKRAVPGAPRP